MIREVKASASFLAPILDVLSDAIIWVYPIPDGEGGVADFEVGYSNKAANDGVNHPKGGLTGLRIRQDGVPSRPGAEENFRHFLQVYQTGEVQEYVFYAHHGNRPFETVRRVYEGGVLSTTRDRRAQREAEQKEEKTARLLRSLVANSPTGIVVYDAVRNEQGKIVDFRIRHFNERSNELTGFSEEERRTLPFRSILEKLGTSSLFDHYVSIVEQDQPFSSEHYIQKTGKWLSRSAVKLDDGFLNMFTDITELKRYQHTLQLESKFSNSILNASLNGIYVLEAVRDENGALTDFTFLRCNERFRELTGLPAEEIMGKTLLGFFPNTQESGLFDLLTRVMETNIAQGRVPYYARSFRKWYDYMAVKLDEDRVVVTFQDITLQQEATLQIETQKNLLNNILTHSPSGVAVYETIRDEAGTIRDFQCIVANDAAARFTGIPNEERLTRTVLQITPDLEKSPIFNMAVSAIRTGEPFHIQYYGEGIGKWLELSVVKMDDDHLINVFTDITGSKETQLKLEYLVEELKRSNANLEEFAYVASHDLQEPLRKIHFFADRLKRSLATDPTGEHVRMLERMESATTRMRQLIDDLLAFSQVSARSDVFHDVDLGNLVALVLQDLETVISESGAEIRLPLLPVVRGNDRQLRQMFQNLIGNALKYRKRDVPPRIEIRCRTVKGTDPLVGTFGEDRKSSYYLLEIQDNGIGFEQSEAERIFQVFQRLHGRTEYEGTGVGLAIVQKVVANHQGHISAESEPGAGATFRILLPHHAT